MGKIKNILFICKFNKFRSVVAEAYLKKINKNKKIKIKSAGIFQGSHRIHKTENIIAKQFNLKIKRIPEGISTDLLKEQDLVVVVAKDVPKSLFIKKYVKKVVAWKIPDTKDGNKKATEKIVRSIIKKIEKLSKTLNKK